MDNTENTEKKEVTKKKTVGIWSEEVVEAEDSFGKEEVVGEEVLGEEAVLEEGAVDEVHRGNQQRDIEPNAAGTTGRHVEQRSGNVMSYADRVNQNPVPLPSAYYGANVPRPNTVVLHTQAFTDLTVGELMLAICTFIRVEAIKSLQHVHGRYRLTFRNPEAKAVFLNQAFTIRGERVVAQEVDPPNLLVKVVGTPDEIPNAAIANLLGQYGRVLKVEREMYRNWPQVETGVRLVSIADLTAGIPRRLRIGPYPIETRYRGQVPQSGRCGDFGHRVATCLNPVKCFKCGQYGHVRAQCFKCFACGEFGHVRDKCPQNVSITKEKLVKDAAGVSDPPIDEFGQDTSSENENSESDTDESMLEQKDVEERKKSGKKVDEGAVGSNTGKANGGKADSEMDQAVDALKRTATSQEVSETGFILVHRKNRKKKKKTTIS